jgi:hypothetical protein
MGHTADAHRPAAAPLGDHDHDHDHDHDQDLDFEGDDEHNDDERFHPSLFVLLS